MIMITYWLVYIIYRQSSTNIFPDRQEEPLLKDHYEKMFVKVVDGNSTESVPLGTLDIVLAKGRYYS